MRLTTATYWRPSGENIHRSREATDDDQWGVSPDEGLEVSFEEEELVRFLKVTAKSFRPFDARNPAEDAATDRRRHERPGSESPDEAEDETPFVDRQLNKAIEYLQEQMSKQSPTESGCVAHAVDSMPAI